MSNEEKLNNRIDQLEIKCKQLEKIIEENNKNLLDLTEKLSNSHICLVQGLKNTIPLNSKSVIQVSQNNEQRLNLILIENLYQLENLVLIGIIDQYIFPLIRNKTLQTLKIANGGLKFTIIDKGNRIFPNYLPGNLPNLSNLEFENCSELYDIIDILKSHEKINSVKIKNCTNYNLFDLHNYCLINNIDLKIS